MTKTLPAPARARWNAVLTPMTPPPMIATEACGGQRLWWAGQFHRVMSAIKHSRPRERLGANGNLFQRG
jgi:hypothetical protein